MQYPEILENINGGLAIFADKYGEVVDLITSPVESFQGGVIFDAIESINGALQAVGYALLVVFCLTGFVKASTSFQDLKRPEAVARMFFRFALGKIVIDYGLKLMLEIFNVGLGIIGTMAGSVGAAPGLSSDVLSTLTGDLPMISGAIAVLVAVLGRMAMTALSFFIILRVYSRFFKIYMYIAIAPIPLSTFAGDGTSQIGWQFVKSFIGVCLEGALIVLACIIYSRFAVTPLAIDAATTPVSQVLTYIGGVLFNMLILLGVINLCSSTTKEMGF